jgi:hypothetical protein
MLKRNRMDGPRSSPDSSFVYIEIRDLLLPWLSWDLVLNKKPGV